MSTETTLSDQEDVSAEIAEIHALADPHEAQPRLAFPPYRSSVLRHPERQRRPVDPEARSCSRPSSAAVTSTRSSPT